MHTVAAVPSIAHLLGGGHLISTLIGVAVIAVVANRLLGARRGLGTTVLAGAIGWLTGTAMAIVLARSHEHGTAGFTRNHWLFVTFFTLSATVWIEMLAKPGALARAQAGLGTIPRPIKSMRRRSQRLSRYVQITRIAARNGLGRDLGVTDDDEPIEGRPPVAVRIRRALEQAGGMFVKLGQVISTRADLVPQSVVDELSKLQDSVSPAPRDAVEAMFEEELGRPVAEVFAEFDWEPLAAASIGQVYSARLKTGEAVIVKAQRPGIGAAVERDLDVLEQLGHTAEARVPVAAEYRVMDLVDEFSNGLREELDFRVEARNATEISRNLIDDRVRIPKVYDELSTGRILVMERFDGVSCLQVDQIDTIPGVDRQQLADIMLRVAMRQMLVDGLFHADPHPGNIFVLRDGTLGLIDFGAAGRLDGAQMASLREMMFAVGQRDASLLRQAVLDVATVRAGFDDDLFERALARFMARHLAPGVPPSAAMFNDLLQLLFSFGIFIPAEFSTFFRSLVTLEGTLKTLAPGYNVIESAEQVATEMVRDQLRPGSVEELAKQEVFKLAPVLRRIPRHIDRLATIAERGDLRARVSLLSLEEDVRVVTTLWNRAILAFLGGIVGLISVGLIAIKGGPDFTGQTSLYEFFGYFGLFCSTVLVMRVLISILRDGLN